MYLIIMYLSILNKLLASSLADNKVDGYKTSTQTKEYIQEQHYRNIHSYAISLYYIFVGVT